METVFAEVYGSSLLPTEVTALVNGFSADIIPTALSLVTIVIPVGLALWAIGFGVKKAISFIQYKAGLSFLEKYGDDEDIRLVKKHGW